ncbi:MAG: flagellar biosynthesis anti-sigma factor FlgM [Bdellovibrionales bacterium]|nr:flagellar biosynthesis anti-sigma factor FlgM [Bdellovibrionales bacterium]
MRINPANSSPVQGSEAQATKKTEKTKPQSQEGRAGSVSAPVRTDSVNADISVKARDMAKAKQVAGEAPDLREAKIAELREKIQNKTYNVSADAIADRLVDDHLRMAGA